MRRTLILSVLVVGVALVLAVASYSALADTGPVTSVADAVVGSGEPDAAVEADDLDADDGENEADEEGDDGKGAREIAGVIAEAFGASEDEVWALHEQGIGFGAIFKLYAFGAPMPTDADGEDEFNFGELRKALTEEQQAALESGPKNLGQIKKAARQAAGGGSGVANEAASAGLEKAREKFAAHESNGHGPPESVPAHGRN